MILKGWSPSPLLFPAAYPSSKPSFLVNATSWKMAQAASRNSMAPGTTGSPPQNKQLKTASSTRATCCTSSTLSQKPRRRSSLRSESLGCMCTVPPTNWLSQVLHLQTLTMFVFLQICDEIGVKAPVNVKMFTGKSTLLYTRLLLTCIWVMPVSFKKTGRCTR